MALHLAHIRSKGPRGSTLYTADLGKRLPPEYWHEDTDRALEYIEMKILANASPPSHSTMNLRALDITQSMTEPEMTVLHQHLIPDCFGAGDTVFLQGEQGDRLYILDSGQVEIQLCMADGGKDRRRIAAFSPGVVFGEMAMFGRGVRSADAIATVDSAVWMLTEESFLALRETYPLVAEKFMHNIARQLAVRLSVTNDELVYATRQ